MYLLLAKAIAIALMVAAAFAAGIKVESNHRDAQLLTQEQSYVKAYQGEVQVAADLGKQLGDKKVVIQTRTQTITNSVDHYIDRPIYNNVCLDPDGLRDANSALSGKTPSSGQLSGAMPGSSTAK